MSYALLEKQVQQAVEAHQRSLQTRDDHKEKMTTLLKQQAITVFQALLATEIPPDILESLALHYEVEVRSDRGYSITAPTAILADDGISWHISQDWPYHSNAWRWSVHAHKERYGVLHDYTTYPDRLCLWHDLLIQIGIYRDQCRKEREKSSLAERNRLLRVQQEAEAEKEREAERIQRIALADQEDARLRALFEERKAQIRENMWHWPNGVEIAIYRISYTAGFSQGGEDGEGDVTSQREEGWVVVDSLDNQGYLTLMPTRSWCGENAPREIKLDLAVHQPIWERWRCSGTNDLPTPLLREVSVHLPKIVKRSDPTLDEKYRLMQVETYDYDERDYREQIGFVPLHWVQELVDQAAQELTS